jgi:hypothetical protein
MAIYTQVLKRLSAIGVILGILLFCYFETEETAVGYTTAAVRTYVNEYNEVYHPTSGVVWKFKKENGHLYKRKYDLDRQEWIGEWVLVK